MIVKKEVFMKKIILSLFCVFALQLSTNAKTIITYYPNTAVSTYSYSTSYYPHVFVNPGLGFSLNIGDSGIYYRSYPRYYTHTHYRHYYPYKSKYIKVNHHRHHGGKPHHKR